MGVMTRHAGGWKEEGWEGVLGMDLYHYVEEQFLQHQGEGRVEGGGVRFGVAERADPPAGFVRCDQSDASQGRP